MSPNELPPDAVLGRPTRADGGWLLEVTCYSCGQLLGSVLYVTEEDEKSFYAETQLVPELVERRSLDPETGWPRFAASPRGDAGRPDASRGTQSIRSAGPVIVACPRTTCGKRQAIVPELEWTIAPGSSTVGAGSVAWGGSRLATWYETQRKANAATREKQPRSKVTSAEKAARVDHNRARRLKRRDGLLRQREKLQAELIADPDGSGAYPAARIQIRLVEQWLEEIEHDLGTVDDAERGER